MTTAAIANAARPEDAQRDQALASIAKITLELDTLDTRNSDGLDFKEQAVWQIKWALEQAYLAGQKAADAEMRRHRRRHG